MHDAAVINSAVPVVGWPYEQQPVVLVCVHIARGAEIAREVPRASVCPSVRRVPHAPLPQTVRSDDADHRHRRTSIPATLPAAQRAAVDSLPAGMIASNLKCNVGRWGWAAPLASAARRLLGVGKATPGAEGGLGSSTFVRASA